MKKTISTAFVVLALLFSCSENEGVTITAEENEARIEQFRDVVRAEVWRVENGMNSSPIIIDDFSEIQEIYNSYGGGISKKADCKFTSGITFTKKDGAMIFAEMNLSEECQSINYFNGDGKMEYYRFRPEGVQLLQGIIDKIELPK